MKYKYIGVGEELDEQGKVLWMPFVDATMTGSKGSSGDSCESGRTPSRAPALGGEMSPSNRGSGVSAGGRFSNIGELVSSVRGKTGADVGQRRQPVW